jgi:thiamine-monophosphate kinase
VITVTALGTVERGLALRRDGARPGDVLYVSGSPGEAAAGLERLGGGAPLDLSDPLVRRYLYAEPRLALGRALAGRATAAMDVSDGLLGDLGKLCAASGVAARLHLDRLPVSSALAAHGTPADRERCMLYGGDDYELLFTLPSRAAAAFEATLRPFVPVTSIGAIETGSGVRCLRHGVEERVEEGGYDHFA